MNRSTNSSLGIRCALASSFVFGLLKAEAGWTGQVNPLGSGSVSVNVSSSTGLTNYASTNMLKPSASITPATGYSANNVSPPGSSTSTYSRIKTSTSLVLSASTFAAGGDGTDNAEIQSRITINPAECAYLAVDTSATFATDGLSGNIKVNATGTEGTAMLLRGYEFLAAGQPADLNDLKAHSAVKWEMLVLGRSTSMRRTAMRFSFLLRSKRALKTFISCQMAWL